MKLTRPKIIVQLFFALLLVAAQGHILVHQVDIEAHSDHHGCEYCLQFSHLGSSDFSEAGSATLSLNIAPCPSFAHVSVGVSVAYLLPPSRAPPVSSFS